MVIGPDDEASLNSTRDQLRSAQTMIDSLRHYDRVELSAEIDYHLEEAVGSLDDAIDLLDEEEE